MADGDDAAPVAGLRNSELLSKLSRLSPTSSTAPSSGVPKSTPAASNMIRHRALERIAAISTSAGDKHGRSDFDRLYSALPRKADRDGDGPERSLARASMTVEELQVLLALCKAAPKVADLRDAERLLDQLSPYLREVHEQSVAPSPYAQLVDRSPWETLSKNLFAAVLSLGIKHHSLRSKVYAAVSRFLYNCTKTASRGGGQAVPNGTEAPSKEDRARDVLVLFLSLLGFLDAGSELAHFFSIAEVLEVVTALRKLLSESFMVGLERALSSVRLSDSSSSFPVSMKSIGKRYAAAGRPMGAMLLQQSFLRFLQSCAALQVAPPAVLQNVGVLDHLTAAFAPDDLAYYDETNAVVEALAETSAEAMRLLEDGADYLELGSAWQQRLAFKIRGYAITIFTCCALANDEIADLDLLLAWLEGALADPVQMADENLAYIVLKALAVTAKTSPTTATMLSRSLPRFLVQGGIHGHTVNVAARSLASILGNLPQDAMITTLYTLGNVLSATHPDKLAVGAPHTHGQSLSPRYAQHATGSAISFDTRTDEETSAVYGNVVRAIVVIALSSTDEKVIPLAQSMLLQKLGRVNSHVDSIIIVETAALGAAAGENELRSLLKTYGRIVVEGLANKNIIRLDAAREAYIQLDRCIPKSSESFQIYLLHLFETIVSKGEVQGGQNSHKADVELAAEGIGQLLKPLALLAPYFEKYGAMIDDESTAPLQREVWFNIAAHGILPGTQLWTKHIDDLRALAAYTRPLIAEDRSDHLESDIELNTVLRRGMSGQRTAEMKKELIKLLPSAEVQIRSLAYQKVIFLHAAYAVETLKADSGTCADVLPYFVDPSVNQDGTVTCMAAISEEVLTRFLRKTMTGLRTHSTGPQVAKELAKVLTACCHRILKCQQMAASFADKLIMQIPSSLCQKSSLFALLELLSLMWSGCLESEIDEYEWKSTFTSSIANVRLELSDDFEFRRKTLQEFHKRSKAWVLHIINVAPQDVKGLLQTYLSEFDDEGAYGHVALGRSFAIEMGSVIPSSDQRLAAIDKQSNLGVNTGSDFVAQYTTRQEYKYADALPDYDQEWVNSLQLKRKPYNPATKIDMEIEDAKAVLSVLDHRVADGKHVPIVELRDLLRRAVALLCRSEQDQCAVLHHLINIPFSIFTKQSIKLGISLWLGVINENHFMESRILVEVCKGWEESVKKKKGIFNPSFMHHDPFFVEEEYAPSDREAMQRRQHLANNLISPHMRILQFMSSHFNAFRLGSPHLRKAFQRMMNVTLRGLEHTSGHPLLREFHLHVILFALSILRHSEDLATPIRWRIKDRILSAALSWFTHSPKWSFGGNRLQIKAECQLLSDVDGALKGLHAHSGESSKTLHSLATKQDLLARLLKHEYSRLHTWLYPANPQPRHAFASAGADKAALSSIQPAMLTEAWRYNPSLAIQIAIRSQNVALLREVRELILKRPDQVLDDPEALHVILESGLSNDVTPQLKYLLYWTPINPVSAVTYFMPSYRNHPFILQYAMRALESHSVDVTFFYVPQIVQTLRYDALGYVERYIIETAKVSQLFAHQIIWNMKANAFKDEESTIEDNIKPTLDGVMKNMIDAFSPADKLFYEKEFAFFGEVTDVSGKLKPYIKKDKSEKKQKIEEELRKIQVEVGVYLPSNPDGVVIGIDRKSGKPLQSHAKAPYMATFRIRKNKGDMGGTENMLENINEKAEMGRSGLTTMESTYDVWQSAIFKVGDDCRQDVLALQMISAFRNIFNSVGLDVWLYPYRVTATAPGCGVIDVLPNSISRDMLGREAVNGLYDYFVSKFGGEDSIRFQEARNNFVKSMASYSVISYLLQFKDRHNGNIMIKDTGHIIHIDFGFCFDIAPGGVKFERAPFKLTSEMIAVMGGSQHSQSYRWFEELCIKAFLASRPYAEKLSHLVVLMLDSGLPCFKPETIAHLKQRFVLDKSEREAAEFMKDLIKKSYGSNSTKVYDQFQLMTNGIPY